LLGNSTISLAIFNSKVLVYQMVPPFLETPIAGIRWKAESIVDLSTSPAPWPLIKEHFPDFSGWRQKNRWHWRKKWSMKNLENGKVV
jgi:hypothetical protein